MPRQNQDHGSYVRGVTSIAPLEKGGTGATTPVQAVDNLKGLHRSSIDKANGLAETDEHGLLKAAYFGNLDIYVGPRIMGPDVLYRGCASEFRVTNFASERLVSVELVGLNKEDVKYIAYGAHFSFVLPIDYAPGQLTVRVHYDGVTRDIVLPVENATIEAPVIKTKDGALFHQLAWLELEAPRYHGRSEFDSYVASQVGGYRANTSTLSADGVHILEAFSYSGVHQVSSLYPVAEVCIAGRLKTEQGEAYAFVDGVKYPLSNVYDEHRIRFKHSQKVDIVTSPGEEIWVGFIRPIGGNKANAATLRTDVVIESSPDGVGYWVPVISGEAANVKNGLSFPLNTMTNGEYFVRARYVYSHQGQTVVSPNSTSIRIQLDTSSQAQVESLAAPYIKSTSNFGAALCYGETAYGKELFATAYVENLGYVVIQEKVTSDGIKYQTTISAPTETDRSANWNLDNKLALSEDGRYLFVASPNAAFTGIAGTTGAVYVFERNGGRFEFICRMIDENRMHIGYGEDVVSVGNALLVMTKSTMSQTPSIYVYQHDAVNDANPFTLKSVFNTGVAGEVNLTNLVAPMGYDVAVSKHPVVLTGAKKSAVDGKVYELNHLCLLDTVNFTLSSSSEVLSTRETPLFGPSIDNDRFVMTYRGFDATTSKHFGYVYAMSTENRHVYAYKWIAGSDGSGFTITDDTLASLGNVILPGAGVIVGGFAVSNDLTRVFAGSSLENLTVQEASGPVVHPQAGIVYSLLLNISQTEVAPA